MNTDYKILVLYYSYTEKTKTLLDLFMEPTDKLDGVKVDYARIKLKQEIPKPWPFVKFFAAFPEIVYEIPQAIEDPDFAETKYDLIIYGHQVWFLSPSTPTASFFNSAYTSIFNDTPVITFMFSRKMWHQAQGRVETLIRDCGGRVINKVVVTAKGSQMKTFMDTRYNLLTEAKTDKRSWKAGQADIETTIKQGQQLAESIVQAKADRSMTPTFSDRSLALSDEMFMGPERVQKKSFLRWGRAMIKYTDKNSRLRELVAIVFATQFIGRIILILPFWPMMFKIKTKLLRWPGSKEIVTIPDTGNR